eukprot:5860833-Prymnesium_polylepis.1
MCSDRRSSPTSQETWPPLRMYGYCPARRRRHASSRSAFGTLREIAPPARAPWRASFARPDRIGRGAAQTLPRAPLCREHRC